MRAWLIFAAFVMGVAPWNCTKAAEAEISVGVTVHLAPPAAVETQTASEQSHDQLVIGRGFRSRVISATHTHVDAYALRQSACGAHQCVELLPPAGGYKKDVVTILVSPDL